MNPSQNVATTSLADLVRCQTREGNSNIRTSNRYARAARRCRSHTAPRPFSESQRVRDGQPENTCRNRRPFHSNTAQLTNAALGRGRHI